MRVLIDACLPEIHRVLWRVRRGQAVEIWPPS
jgi:hypothetical protein